MFLTDAHPSDPAIESAIDEQIEGNTVKRKRRSVSVENKTKKRKRNPANWEKTRRQVAYRSGEGYTRKTGEVVPPLFMGPGCKETCRFKCHGKIDEASRQEVYDNYVQKTKIEGSKSIWEFVGRHVKRNPRAEITSEDSKRTCTAAYFFRHKGNDIKVCREMFLKTFNMSNSVVDKAFMKLGGGGVISPSKQGKHNKRPNAIPQTLKESVRCHIALYPKADPHYVRKDSNREYLQEGKTIAEMHRAYVGWMKNGQVGPAVQPRHSSRVDDSSSERDLDDSEASEDETEENYSRNNNESRYDELNDDSSGSDLEVEESAKPDQGKKRNVEEDVGKIINGVKVASYRQYTDIFNEEFNIGTHLPKKDECDFCFRFKYCTEEEKNELKEELEKHFALKNKIRDLKLADKHLANEDGSTVLFCCFDMQKILLVPQGASSAFFYQSKLSCYNETCWSTHLNQKKAYLYTWHEGQLGKGANEVASCVFLFIETAVRNQPIENPPVKEVRLWGDNCISQNKNRFIFSMEVFAAENFEITIIHRFLLKGHTQNEGDSVHARIETESKGKRLFVPSHWRRVMRDAKKKDEDYIVVKMDQSKVYDFEDLFSRQNWEYDVNGNKIKWTQVTEIKIVGGTRKAEIQYNYDPDSTVILRVDQRQGRPLNLKSYLPIEAYDGLLPIAAKKKKALLKLCEKLVVPTKYHTFYQALCAFAPTKVPKEKNVQAK